MLNTCSDSSSPDDVSHAGLPTSQVFFSLRLLGGVLLPSPQSLVLPISVCCSCLDRLRSSPHGVLFGSRTHQITFITPEDKRVEMREASCSVVLETDGQRVPHTVPAIGPGVREGPSGI
ncbi:unnamed protein product [Boreogadus saida]